MRKKHGLSLFCLAVFIGMFYAGCTPKGVARLDKAYKQKGDVEYALVMRDDYKISGTLNYSNQDAIMVMVAGSGPTDRNCNSALGLKSDAFKQLAESLAANSISSYRYDKRGIAANEPVDEIHITMYDFIDDLYDIVQLLNHHFDKVYVMGHSEGALIASKVAAENSNVDGLIAVSGISESMDKVILTQLETYPALVPMAQKHVDEINSGAELSEVNPFLQSLFRESLVPFLKSAFALDPAEEISKVSARTLIVGGACDLQVPISHADKLHEVASSSEKVIIPNMGHVMKKLEGDCSNARAAYENPTWSLNPTFEAAVINFLQSQQ